MKLRGHNPRLLELRGRPYQALRPWLLSNRTSVSNSYVLISARGTALVIDFGYDFAFGTPPATTRDTRRPWLYTLPALKAQFGIDQIEAVIPTHAHDDHVAGIGLLREQYGAQLWAAEPLAGVLARPADSRLPCRWFEALTPDRVLVLGMPVEWEDFQITPYALPGHARHAVALLVEGHGERIVFVGDQYAGEDGLGLNYTYQNDFLETDYLESAALISRLRPDLLLSGHWPPVVPDENWLVAATARGEALRQAHAELHPLTSRLLLTVTPVEASQGQLVEITLMNPTQQVVAGHLTVDGRRQEWGAAAQGQATMRLTPNGAARRIPVVFSAAAHEAPLIAFLTLK